jgi:hypothetical protein
VLDTQLAGFDPKVSGKREVTAKFRVCLGL